MCWTAAVFTAQSPLEESGQDLLWPENSRQIDASLITPNATVQVVRFSAAQSSCDAKQQPGVPIRMVL